MDHDKARKVSFIISSIASLEGQEKMVKVNMDIEVPLIFSISMQENHLHKVIQKCTTDGLKSLLDTLITKTIGDNEESFKTSINELKGYIDEYVDQA